MVARSGLDNRSGPRLPLGPKGQSEPLHRCDIDPAHGEGIRFELGRYSRRVGRVHLCGACFRRLNPFDPRSADMLTVVPDR